MLEVRIFPGEPTFQRLADDFTLRSGGRGGNLNLNALAFSVQLSSPIRLLHARMVSLQFLSNNLLLHLRLFGCWGRPY